MIILEGIYGVITGLHSIWYVTVPCSALDPRSICNPCQLPTRNPYIDKQRSSENDNMSGEGEEKMEISKTKFLIT